MKRALLIPAEGKPRVIDVSETNELEALQQAVGGWIEYVPTQADVTLYCNEEGKIQGLPANRNATLAFGSLLMQGDYLAGDVVILGPLDDEGENTSIDEQWIEFFGVQGVEV